MLKRKQINMKESLQAAPPVAVSALALFGVSLENWILILTLAYLVFQLALMIRKVYYIYKADRRAAKRATEAENG